MSSFFISYAQNFEDLMLWRALHQVSDGFYIDIGAQDPLIDSVSYAFHERGWRGVHVEPVPRYAERLREGRPDETVVQAAIGGTSALIKFWEVPGSGWSTGDKELASTYRSRGVDLREFDVPCISLASLLNQYSDREIHWLKIDVEGMEDAVIDSWVGSTVRPWVLVVEATMPNSTICSHMTWDPKLRALGYSFVYFDGLNRFYVSERHADLSSTFHAPPNVFDNFALSGTAQNPTCSVVNQKIQNLGDLSAQLQASLTSVSQQLLETQEGLTSAKAEKESLERYAREKAAEVTLHLQRSDETIVHLRATLDGRDRELEKWQERFRTVTEDTVRLTELIASKDTRIADMHRARVSMAKKVRLHAQLVEKKDLLLQEALERARKQELLIADLMNQLSGMQKSWAWKLASPLGLLEPGRSAKHFSVPSQSDRGGVVRKSSADDDRTGWRVLDILAKNGASFVEAAYLAILNRNPDDNGSAYYQNVLHMGASKLEVLSALRQSEEGRVANTKVSGLDWRCRIFRWSRIPVLGRMVSLALRKEIFVERKNRKSVTDLTLLRGKDFIEAAYRVMLHRPPDEDGLKTYLDALKGGTTKVQILEALGHSPEGKVIHPNVRGLSSAIAFEHCYQIPFIGRVLRAWVQSGTEVVWCEEKKGWRPKSSS